MRKILICLGALALLLASAGCSSGDKGDGGSGSDTGGKAYGVMLLLSDPFFSLVADTVKELAQKDGNKIIVVDSASSSSAEATNIQNLVSRGVDGIMMSPVDAASASSKSFQIAARSKVPLVCYNTGCLDEDKADATILGDVESDNAKLGVSTAEYIGKYVKDKKITDTFVMGVINCDKFGICKQRSKGFFDTLDKLGVKYKIAANQYSVDPAESATIATNMLTANPDINFMWSDGGNGVAGIVTALKQADKTNKVMVFGTDILPPETAALLKGSLIATTGQDAVSTAKRAYEILKSGKRSASFVTNVPGLLYSQDDLDAVRAYVEKTK